MTLDALASPVKSVKRKDEQTPSTAPPTRSSVAWPSPDEPSSPPSPVPKTPKRGRALVFREFDPTDVDVDVPMCLDVAVTELNRNRQQMHEADARGCAHRQVLMSERSALAGEDSDIISEAELEAMIE